MLVIAHMIFVVIDVLAVVNDFLVLFVFIYDELVVTGVLAVIFDNDRLVVFRIIFLVFSYVVLSVLSPLML